MASIAVAAERRARLAPVACRAPCRAPSTCGRSRPWRTRSGSAAPSRPTAASDRRARPAATPCAPSPTPPAGAPPSSRRARPAARAATRPPGTAPARRGSCGRPGSTSSLSPPAAERVAGLHAASDDRRKHVERALHRSTAPPERQVARHQVLDAGVGVAHEEVEPAVGAEVRIERVLARVHVRHDASSCAVTGRRARCSTRPWRGTARSPGRRRGEAELGGVVAST